MPGADYNIAPTTYQPMIRESWDQARERLGLARWGLALF